MKATIYMYVKYIWSWLEAYTFSYICYPET
jgi:hypothetical protein